MKNKNLLLYSFLVFFVFLLTYNFFIDSHRFARTISENQWADNRKRAEQYLYDKNDSEIVIVGSSLARMLWNYKIFPRKTFNIAMSGQSAFDGLKILIGSDAHPEIVMIEVNHLERSDRKSFWGPLLNPLLFNVKKYIYAMREDGRPVTIFLTLAKPFVDNMLKYIPKMISIAHAAPVQIKLESKVVNQFLEREIQFHAIKPDTKKIMERLLPALDVLSSRDVKFVFFEMATHPELCKSPHLLTIRESIEGICLKYDCEYILADDCNKYPVKLDGHHLTQKSAGQYSIYLANKLKKIINPNT